MTAGMERHRDKNGELSKKHGNTLVRTLRRIYGPGFAQHEQADAKLSDVLEHLDASSLTELVRHHEAGSLTDKIKTAES